MKEEDIYDRFMRLTEELTDREWQDWVHGWLDEEEIVEIYQNWSEETMKDEIGVLEKIIKKRGKK